MYQEEDLDGDVMDIDGPEGAEADADVEEGDAEGFGDDEEETGDDM